MLVSYASTAYVEAADTRSATVVFRKPQTCGEATEILSGTSAMPNCRIDDPKPKRAFTAAMIGTPRSGAGMEQIRKNPKVQSLTPDDKKR